MITYSNITPDGKTNVYVEKSNSAKGVSDSTFTNFSVSKNGAVINNATGIGRSVIAGIVNPNKNLKDPARLKKDKEQSSFRSGLDLSLEISKTKIGVGLGINVSNEDIENREKLNESSNVILSGKSKIEDVAEFKSTNLKYEDLEIKSDKVLFDSNKDEIDKKVSLNEVVGTEERYTDVKEAKIKGTEFKDSKARGEVKELVLEDTKDEYLKQRDSFGADLSLSKGMILGNVKVETEDVRKETLHKQETDLRSKETKKVELKEDNHERIYGIGIGTSGIYTRIKEDDKINIDVDLSSETIKALTNPSEFKEKLEFARDEIETTAKGIKLAYDTRNAKSDDKIDISEHEKTGVLKGGEYYLNAKYDKKLEIIRKEEAKTKEQRREVAKKIGFEDYKIIDPENLPKEVMERNKQIEEASLEGDVKIFVGENNVLYVVGKITEEEFKKGLAREYGILKHGRNVDGKILGATAGDIYAEHVKGSGEDKEENFIEYDKVQDGEIGKIVSDDRARNREEYFNALKRSVNQFNYEYAKKGFMLALHTASIIGDLVEIGISGGLTIPMSAITIVDSLDEINKILSGCEGENCETYLNKLLGDKKYYMIKGTSAVIGVVQTGKFVKNVAEGAIKTASKADDVAKLSNVSKVAETTESFNTINKVSKLDDAEKVASKAGIKDFSGLSKSEVDKLFVKVDYTNGLIEYDDIPKYVYEKIRYLQKNKLLNNKGMPGNSKYHNYTNLLPSNIEYREFDIKLNNGKRGSERDDHYKSFKKLK